jgi:hypothetical protein
MMKDDVYQLPDIPYTTTTTTKKKKRAKKNWENGRHCRMEMTSRISPNCVWIFLHPSIYTATAGISIEKE